MYYNTMISGLKRRRQDSFALTSTTRYSPPNVRRRGEQTQSLTHSLTHSLTQGCNRFSILDYKKINYKALHRKFEKIKYIGVFRGEPG